MFAWIWQTFRVNKNCEGLARGVQKIECKQKYEKERTRDVRVCVFGRFRTPTTSPSGLPPSLLALIACKTPWGEQSEIKSCFRDAVGYSNIFVCQLKNMLMWTNVILLDWRRCHPGKGWQACAWRMHKRHWSIPLWDSIRPRKLDIKDCEEVPI